MAINEGKYEKLFNTSLDVLDSILRRKSDEPMSNDDIYQAKVATSVLSSYPKHKAAIASAAGVTLEVLKGAAENVEQYREFIRAHMPRTGIIKTIPEVLEDGRKNVVEMEKHLQDLQSGRDNRLATALSQVDELKRENQELRFEVSKK